MLEQFGAELGEPDFVETGDEVMGSPADFEELGERSHSVRTADPGARGFRKAGPASPATRTSKNSSRLDAQIDRNRSRSSRGFDGSRASSSTRSLKSSQLSSRLMNKLGVERRRRRGYDSDGGRAILLIRAPLQICLAAVLPGSPVSIEERRVLRGTRLGFPANECGGRAVAAFASCARRDLRLDRLPWASPESSADREIEHR